MDAHAPIRHEARLPPEALARLELIGCEPVLASSFAVGTAAQTSLAAAALAASEVGRHRNGLRQQMTVDVLRAALECCGHFTIDGRSPALWDPIAGLYLTADGWARLHTNFAHHRDGVLRLLGLQNGSGVRGVGAPDFTGLMQASACGYGELSVMCHSALFSRTPAAWVRPSVPPGTHPLSWASG